MVFVMLQGCMRLVADSVPVEHVLSGVCAIRDCGVHTCYSDAYVLLQIQFLSSVFCLVFALYKTLEHILLQ